MEPSLSLDGCFALPEDVESRVVGDVQGYFQDGRRKGVLESLYASAGQSVRLRLMRLGSTVCLHRSCGTTFHSADKASDLEASSGPGACNRLPVSALKSLVHGRAGVVWQPATVALQRNSANFFHFVTEVLPSIHVWWRSGLLPERYSGLLVTSRAQFVAPLIEALGVRAKVMQIAYGGLVVLRDAVVPQLLPAQFTHEQGLLEVAAVLRHMGQGPDMGAHVFIRRSSNTSRSLANEDRVVHTARSILGTVAILDPSTMPIEQQMAALRKAEVVVSPHGAQLTGLLWSEKLRSVIEIDDVSSESHEYRSLASLMRASYQKVPASVAKRPQSPQLVCDLAALRTACQQVK